MVVINATFSEGTLTAKVSRSVKTQLCMLPSSSHSE